ncbi:tryptophanyl-tRNA synthetase [Oceanospirillum multiglobuliferum]|uniref:Tryptophan--tRNA ligase n=1 Tax=Oceanospirillum multiglobuliferum TaxID=64969 RepID=A0A1T4RUG7_9GAMM|nr:tryptophan--tRNA ligase [Oceanospirillum multiglobuliferum]OPX54621.1 tryptophan--tRNA ligase [Oceanospirillum multiglobuliferum]SKA19644.1 tryptophanyl-tRNA synthetase [Oceanospirillum multiglobuliferum]
MDTTTTQSAEKRRVLTGITTTGTPHLGNYVGAIRPAIEASRDANNESFYFLADLHALIKCHEPQRVQESRREIAATWLALGLDTDNAVFYRQSDVPEITELTWLLTCVCAKGLMNRAHAYKAAVQENEADSSADPDKGITMGLFSYPILMAADILMFNATDVPVGRDQIQHIEMARDVAQRFNHIYQGQFFKLPEARIEESVAVLNGLDGRKMSKSYNNTIPLFEPEKKLLKLIRKIKTNSLEPGEPKETEGCTLFQIWQAFADEGQVADMRLRYENGIGWGEMKNELFELVNSQIQAPRARYVELMNDMGYVEEVMKKGAEKARDHASPLMAQLRKAVGFGAFV